MCYYVERAGLIIKTTDAILIRAIRCLFMYMGIQRKNVGKLKGTGTAGREDKSALSDCTRAYYKIYEISFDFR